MFKHSKATQMWLQDLNSWKKNQQKILRDKIINMWLFSYCFLLQSSEIAKTNNELVSLSYLLTQKHNSKAQAWHCATYTAEFMSGKNLLFFHCLTIFSFSYLVNMQ